MNATNKPIWVAPTIDVQPTPDAERRNPLGSPQARSPLPRSPLRESHNPIDQWVAQQASDASTASDPQDRPKKPRWLRKVLAWLAGTWGKGSRVAE